MTGAQTAPTNLTRPSSHLPDPGVDAYLAPSPMCRLWARQPAPYLPVPRVLAVVGTAGNQVWNLVCGLAVGQVVLPPARFHMHALPTEPSLR